MSTVPSHLTVPQLFTIQANLTPDAPALDGSHGPITYAQLRDRALRLAHALQSHGVRPGHVVATCLDPAPDTIASFLAILYVGAAYCPLDPKHPLTRQEFTLADTTPTVLITTAALRDRLPESTPPLLLLDDAAHFATLASELPPPVAPDAPACILYTSGSTGKPKGALVPHAGIVRLIFGIPDVPLSTKTRLLLHSPLTFDVSTFEIFGPLLHGGVCVLFPGGRVPTLHELKQTIRDYRVDTLFFGPAPANIIIDEDPDVLTGLRTLILGGEAMSAPHARKCLALHPNIRIVNGYGPTEATTFASSYAVPADFPPNATSVPIGKPLALTTYYVVDEQNRLVTDGSPGELLIGGAGVALGYLNRPDLTREKFIPDTFTPGAKPTDRLYRTGDLCRLLPDGNFDYIGRIDNQIKLYGHRIEPGEIEAAVAAYPGVSQAVVTVRDDRENRRLCAYYTTLPTATVATESLRGQLSARLPHYMVPTWLVPLDKMPITPSGKVDRRALPAPQTAHTEAAATNTPESRPTTQAERDLVALWKQILEVDHVSPNDSFFALGGSSLGAMRLCSLIERQTGKFVPVATLFASPTPAQMAAALERQTPSTAPTLSLQLTSGDAAPLFCLPGQGGYAVGFQPLARHLKTRHPVYGLNFPGLDGVTEPARTVQELAKAYLAEIRRIQPNGPYNFLGYSYGGLAAFELACLLRQAGQPVARLILVEAFTARSFRSRSAPGRALVHAKRLVQNGFTATAVAVAPPPAFPKTPELPPGQLLEAHERVNALNAKALRKYRPGNYPGDVTCVLADDLPDWTEFYVIDPTGGWRNHVTGNLTLLSAPGTHVTIMQEPNVAHLASVLNQCLS